MQAEILQQPVGERGSLFKVVSAKTAALFSAAAHSGAVLSGQGDDFVSGHARLW